MSKNIRIIYLYIVSFIALCMIIGGFISTVHAIASYVFPVRYSSYSYRYEVEPNVNEIIVQTDETKITTLENEKALELAKQEDIYDKNEKRRELRNIVTSSAVLVIGVPLFAYSWIKIEKERKEELEKSKKEG